MKMTLDNLFKRYPGGLCIPYIQRGYVQGRDDDKGKELQATFAPRLVEAVFRNRPLTLDFVYGITEGEGAERRLLPLDGQQRLTTLFLLAWLCGAWKREWCFTYKARRIPQLFVKGLAELQYDKTKGTPSEQIEMVGWFLPIWKREPSVAGMLRMLDALRECLGDAYDPKEANFQNVTFCLHGIDSSSATFDHIFRKMNARGKALSAWENMKAMLDKYLPEKLEEIWRDKIDGDWAECIWEKTGRDARPDIAKLDNAMEKIIRVAYARVACVHHSVDHKQDGTLWWLDEPLWKMEEALKEKVIPAEEFYETAVSYYENVNFIAESWSKDRTKNALWGDVTERDDTFWTKLVDDSRASLADILRWAFLSVKRTPRRQRVLLNLLDASEKNITRRTVAKALSTGLKFLAGELEVEKIEQSGYSVEQVKDEVRKWRLTDEQRVKALERNILVHCGSLCFIGWEDFQGEADIEQRLNMIRTQVQGENWKAFYRNLASRLDKEKVDNFSIPVKINDYEHWRDNILVDSNFVKAIVEWHQDPTPRVEPSLEPELEHLFELFDEGKVKMPGVKKYDGWFFLLNTESYRSKNSIRLDYTKLEHDHRDLLKEKDVFGTAHYQQAELADDFFDVYDETWWKESDVAKLPRYRKDDKGEWQRV